MTMGIVASADGNGDPADADVGGDPRRHHDEYRQYHWRQGDDRHKGRNEHANKIKQTRYDTLDQLVAWGYSTDP